MRGQGGRSPSLFSCIFKMFLKRQRYFIAACPEKRSFHSGRGGGGGGGWGLGPLFLNFLDPPLMTPLFGDYRCFGTAYRKFQ